MSDLSELAKLCQDRAVPQYAYAIHTVKPDDAVGAVEVIYTDEQEARSYAASRSTDYTITSASVTRYTVAELGTRHPLLSTWTVGSLTGQTVTGASSTRPARSDYFA